MTGSNLEDCNLCTACELASTRQTVVISRGNPNADLMLIGEAPGAQEDAQGIAVSSYQGGHTEFFSYMIDMLRQRNRPDIRVFGGGGGVIVDEEIKALHDYGGSRIYSPGDGQHLGLQGMIDDMLERADFYPAEQPSESIEGIKASDGVQLARVLTEIENDTVSEFLMRQIRTAASRRHDHARTAARGARPCPPRW